MNRIFVLFLVFSFLSVIPIKALEYDYTSTESIPIKLSPMVELSTADGIIEGETLNLRVLDNVYHNGKLIIKTGEIATAKVETSITAGMNGFPAEIILGDFEIPGIKSSKLLLIYL